MKLRSLLLPALTLALAGGASAAHADSFTWSKFEVPGSFERCMSLAEHVALRLHLNIVEVNHSQVVANDPVAAITVTCIGPVPAGSVAVLMVQSARPDIGVALRESMHRHILETCGGGC